MLLGRMENRVNHLRNSCSRTSTRIWARNGLAVSTPAANFLACASWKCSSTYWKRFNQALTNATGSDGETEDVVKSDDSIRGTYLSFVTYILV